jgi:hypothetical protein
MAREAEMGESSNLLPSLQRRDEAPPSDVSRTIELSAKGAAEPRNNNLAKWFAVMVGVAIILLAALLPDTVKNLGSRKATPKEPPSSGVLRTPANMSPEGAKPSGAIAPAPGNSSAGSRAPAAVGGPGAASQAPQIRPAPSTPASGIDAGAPTSSPAQ